MAEEERISNGAGHDVFQPHRPSSMRRASPVASVLAIIIAVSAITVARARQPFGNGLSDYDLSSAEAAFVSMNRILHSGPSRAGLELSELLQDRGEPDLATLRVHKVVDWKEGKLLFVSFEVNGAVQYETPLYSKDAETGYWREERSSESIALPKFTAIAASFDEVAVEVDPIETMAQRWREAGTLN